MADYMIGSWVRREKRGLYHLVESDVANAAITKCGRRLEWETTSGGKLRVFVGPQERPGWDMACRVCADTA
jgi:hypothetical protein